MDLRAWLEREGQGAKTRLARAVGCRWATIHDLAEGHATHPRPETAQAIERATEGEVTAAELLGLGEEPQSEATGA